MLKLIARGFIVSCALLLASCDAPPPPKVNELSFTKLPIIKVNVANIEVVDAYKSPYKAPNIEHLMPYTPADAMHIWVKDRLRATGSDKLLQITILDAPVTSTDLPTSKGVKGVFTVEQDKRFDAKLEVEMRLYGGEALSEANTSVSVMRSITIPENASVNARRAAYEKLIAEMMDMLNAKLENNMLNYMGNAVSFSGK